MPSTDCESTIITTIAPQPAELSDAEMELVNGGAEAGVGAGMAAGNVLGATFGGIGAGLSKGK